MKKNVHYLCAEQNSGINKIKKLSINTLVSNVALWVMLLMLAPGFAISQTTISQWTFDPLQGTNANPTPNTGSGTANLVGSMVGFGGTATGMSGTGCGAQTSGTSAWAISSANPGTTNESSGAQFVVSTVGRSGIIVQWDQRFSNTSANTVRLQYTTDGGSSWNNFTMTPSNTTLCAGSINNGRFENNAGDVYRRVIVNLSAITAVDNNPNFGFRAVAAHYQSTGQFRQSNTPANVATAGTWRFDNVTVSGTVISANPIVNLSVDINAASESAATVVTVTATASAAVTGNQTVSLGVSGTGITAGDYNLSNTTITIPNGSTTGTVTFTIVDDADVEGTETATLTISSPSSGIALGTTTTQNITITDNDFPTTPTVSLSVSTNTASESAATVVTVTATASSAVSGNQTVSLAVSGTGITAGDYNLSNTTITIPDGSTTGTVTLTIVDDAIIEGTETVTLTISSPSSGIALGTTNTQNITITDNDIATVLTFVRSDTTALESAGTAKVFMRVTTAGNVAGSVDLSVSTYSTATGSGTDYSVPVTLNIPANTTVGQLLSFDFTINDDAAAEADEYVICKTTNAVNASVGGTNTQSTLYIRDNDKPAPVASNQLSLSFVSSFSNGASGTNSLEISTFDSASKRIFVANSVANKLDIINFANPSAPVLISSINLGVAPFNGAINSVDVFNGTVALALEGLTDKQANGKVVFTDINGTYISEVAAGAMPDMITFNHAGTKVYTANEGEPNAAYTNDPVGSITVVDISGGVASPSATTIGFTAYNGQETALRSQGIRIYGVTQPGSVPSTAAQDFEPEYITISDDDSKAWVTLQENNALVELDLSSNTIVKLIPLGYKDHSNVNNPFDVSDQTFGINLSNFNVKGMYEPDAISQYTSGGTLYLLTANEGDSRAYTGFSEETRVNALTLDPTVYPNSAEIKNNAVLGRLTVTNKLGDIDNDGDIDQIYCLGGRSFSIWNPAAVTPLVYDSKDDLERITSTNPTYSQFFNMSNTVANTPIKNRSDDKGPEPEGVTVGKIGDRTYAFVSLERIGGVMIYDITNPASPAYVTYANSRTISGGDRGAEGIIFVPASQSPNGKNLVLLSNEISSTLSVFEIAPCTAPGIASIANIGSTSICPGSFVKLYNIDNNAAYTRQWLKDGAVISGATDSVYNATTNGSYRLVTFNSTGCVDTSAVITVTTIPAATVNLSVSSNSASETAATAVTVTATASAPVCGNQTVFLGVSGTGITAGDYTLSNTTITILDGQTTGSVTFTVVNDNVVEPVETAVLTISSPSSGIVLGGTTTQNITISDFVFTLQVLHASDFEAAVEAVADAPRFAAIVDTLEGTYTNTIKLSSGDNYIPGPFLSSGEDPSLAAAYKTAYESYYNTTFNASSVNLLPSIGRADISIMNFIGIEASALGNHEFDLGTNEVRNIIRGANNTAGTVRTWFGAQFPYLSANLNFSGDGNLSAIATTNRLLPNTAFSSNPSESVSTITNKLKLAPSTIINKGGQKIGIVGATTQVLASISSPGATTVVGGGANDMTILAGILQPVINDLIADGCNKIILLSHLQQISLEKELAGKISGVDIIMAGGSNTLMADGNDRLRAGDVAAETYPFLTTGLDGKAIALINTDGNYKYVGRLVVDFDAAGTLIPTSIDPVISGVYAADAQGVNDAWGANVGNAFAVGTRGYQVQLLCTAIGNVITVKDGNLFGKTSVFLEGRRNFVRTEETNLGNISAEANLWMAKFYDPATVISIKNGGGIRSAIGNVIAVGNNVTLVPPIANPSAGKQSGDISQLDIENSLRFNNQLSLVTLTASGMRSILENAVAATTATATPGQFAQVAGVRYSYNFSLPAGSRILNAVVTNAAGNIVDTLVLNGTTYGNLSRTFRVVTLNFLAGGGDGYPFNTLGTNRVDLNTVPAQGPALASFANAGSEQDAFAEYMKNQFSTTPYGIAETALAQDCRIQRVPARTDNVLPPNPGTNGTLVTCDATPVTESQLFAALGGTPATGGTWSPALAGAGVYTYTVTSASCSGSASAKVTVTTPIAALVVSGPTNVCPFIGTAQQLTYSVVADPAATSYQWTVPPTVTLVSGQGTNSINITIGSGFIANANKVIKVRSLSSCGNSSETLYYLLAQLPSTPGSISGPVSVCAFLGAGSATYSVAAVAGASSYIWTAQPGTTITFPNGNGVNGNTVNISFPAGFTTSSITVRSANDCGTSAARSLQLVRANPSTPGLISGPTNVCAFILPGATVAATYSINPVAGATSYNWVTPPGSVVTHPNGSGVNDVIITVLYPAGFTGGAITVSATNSCGTSGVRNLNIAKLNPATPGVIDVLQTGSCPARQFTYTIAGLPANATSIQWTVPAPATLVSGQGTTSITVIYPATVVEGIVTATAISNCGTSVARQTPVKLPACPPALPFTRITTTEGNTTAVKNDAASISVLLFPNPAISGANLKVETKAEGTINVRVIDVYGRTVIRTIVPAYKTTSFGSQLKSGTYFIEVTQGQNKVVEKLIVL